MPPPYTSAGSRRRSDGSCCVQRPWNSSPGPNSSEKFEGAGLRACGSGGRLEIRGGRRRRKLPSFVQRIPTATTPGLRRSGRCLAPEQVVSLAFVLSLFSASRELSEQHHERALARANLLRAAANYGIDTSPV